MVCSVKKEFDGAFCSVFRGNISVFLCVSLFFMHFEFFVDGGSCEGCCYKN